VTRAGVQPVQFDSISGVVVSSGYDSTLRIFDAVTGATRHVITHPTCVVARFDVSVHVLIALHSLRVFSFAARCSLPTWTGGVVSLSRACRCLPNCFWCVHAAHVLPRVPCYRASGCRDGHAWIIDTVSGAVLRKLGPLTSLGDIKTARLDHHRYCVAAQPLPCA